MTKSKPRVALIWANFGPYHLARSRALGSFCDLVPIEMVAHQRQYGWAGDRSEFVPAIRTLAAGAYEDQSALGLSVAVYRMLDEVQPDVVLIPGWWELWALTAALWVRMHRRRAIIMSESTFEDNARSRWREWVKRQVVRRLADGVTVGGLRSAAYLESLGIERPRMAFCYDAVDNEFFSAHSDHLRKASTAVDFGLPDSYFLFVGRLAPEKNLDLLLSSFGRYVCAGGRWSLVLVGDGPLKRHLQTHPVISSVPERVLFAGFQDGSELVPYYAFAGCFILPSIREPWGLVVNEAMACRLPAIVSDRCGCSADLVVHGINGYVFDPTKEGELADCMLHMDFAPEHERAAMASRSREIVANYTPQRWASQVLRLINEWRPSRPARE